MRKHTRMRGRGASDTLKSWAKKALSVVRQYGPALARKTKIGSRALTSLSKSNPKYSGYIDPVNNFVKQQGYGLRSAGGMSCRAHGSGLRSTGGRRRKRR